MTENKILTTEQIAELLQVSYETARRLLKAGKIPGTKIGRSWRVIESDLRSFIEAGYGGQK